MKKREVISHTKPFILVKQTRDHKIWYEIQVDWVWPTLSFEKELTEYFGHRHQGGNKLSWQFWNRIEAEKQFLFAVLRWA